MRYDAVVIGAGIAGLSAALKLSAGGKKVLLLEKEPSAGGYASSFKRQGFTFEAAVHCVDSLGPRGEVRRFLEEQGVAAKLSFIELKAFGRIIYPGREFTADFRSKSFARYLKDNFPSEEKGIDRFFLYLKNFYCRFDRFCASKLPDWLNLALLPFVCPGLIILSPQTLEQFLSRYFRDDKLKAIVGDIWRFSGLPPAKLSALFFLLVFRGYYYEPTAYVKGGMRQIFLAMAEKLQENGSEIRYNTRVQKIITGAGRVKAVVSDRGEEFSCRAVISNANAIETLTRMLDDAKARALYEKTLLPLDKSISAFQVYLGLSVPARELGMRDYFLAVNSGYDHEDDFRRCLASDYDSCFVELVDHSRLDPGLAPAGKGTLLIMALDNYANWRGLSREAYSLKKEAAKQKLISRAERYLPGLQAHIEVAEAATPLTMQRYTGSPEGAIYGFAHSPEQSMVNRPAQETRIKGLVLAGAWTRPGAGVHSCFVSGWDAAEYAERILGR